MLGGGGVGGGGGGVTIFERFRGGIWKNSGQNFGSKSQIFKSYPPTMLGGGVIWFRGGGDSYTPSTDDTERLVKLSLRIPLSACKQKMYFSEVTNVNEKQIERSIKADSANLLIFQNISSILSINLCLINCTSKKSDLWDFELCLNFYTDKYFWCIFLVSMTCSKKIADTVFILVKL